MKLHDGWEQILPELIYNDDRELAIVQIATLQWVVLSDKKNPTIVAMYKTLDEAYSEWSHA